MRDVIKIVGAGLLLTGYALIAPSIVEAVPGGAGAGKPFAQRLAPVEVDAPVSAVEAIGDRMTIAPRATMPRFARLETVR